MADVVEREIGELTAGIDRDVCIGSGNCIKVGPDLFEFDDHQVCAFRRNVGELDRENIIEACAVCPVDALIVRDNAGTELVP